MNGSMGVSQIQTDLGRNSVKLRAHFVKQFIKLEARSFRSGS